MAPHALRAFTATLLAALSGASASIAMAAPATPAALDAPAKPADLVRLDRLQRELAGPVADAGRVARPVAPVGAPSAIAQAGTLDTTPPTLTALKLPVTVAVDAAGVADQQRATFSANDDLAGVTFGYAVATGPAGQLLTVNVGTGVANKSIAGGRGMVSTHQWLVPGTYTVNYLVLYDGNWNQRNYATADLAALGIRTTLEVTNALGGDAVPPVLVKGTIRTPTFSLSARAPGSDQFAQFIADVQFTDAGNGQASGLRTGFVTFCQHGKSPCLTLPVSEALPNGVLKGTTVAAQRPGSLGLPAGDYQLYSVELYDYAGNKTTLLSTEGGGSTDFTPLFNVTTIHLTT